MRNDLKETLRTHMKRFKSEKAMIVRCDDTIPSITFKKKLSIGPIFKELIMEEYLTLVNSYALADN